ncbi:MAG: hypothetical protein ACTSUN_09485 [Promethearchaeota archaeon]
MKKTGKRVLNYYNYSQSLENIIKFLESIQKKVNFLDLNVLVERNSIKITLHGPRDLQSLAIDKLNELANLLLKKPL